MSQKTRMAVTSLALLVLAGGAGAYAWYGVHEPKQAEEQQKKADARLLPEDLGEVTKVVLTRPDGRIVLEKAGARDWKVKAPVQVDADAGAVEALLSRVKDASRKTLVANADEVDGAARAKYGLAAPRLTIAVTTKDGETAVAFGRENAFDGTVYARAGEGAVGLFPKTLLSSVDKGLFDLREKRLLRFDDAEVKSLSVELDGGSYRLARTGPEAWTVRGIAQDRADTATVRTLLSALSGLRAIAFPTAVAPDGLAPPEATVRVGLDSGAELTLALAKAKDDASGRLYATGSGVTGVAQVGADFVSRLKKGPFDLRWKKVLDLDRDAVAKLEVKGKDGTYAVTKDPGEKGPWKVSAPKAEAAKQWRVSSLLYTLADLQATRFAVEQVDAKTDLGAYGLAAPERTITAYDGGGKVLGVLKVGSQPQGKKDQRYVMSEQGDRIYEVPETRLSGLAWTLAEVEDTPAPVAQTK